MPSVNFGPSSSQSVNQAPGLDATWSDPTGTFLVKPDGTLQSALGLPSGAFTPSNGNNGPTLTLSPVNTTGLNANSSNWLIDTASSEFTGNLYNDPVIALGYNVSASSGVKSQTPDPSANGIWFESDYNVDSSLGGTASGGSTTTLVDGSKTFGINSLINWVVYNVTTGGRGLITANTGTTLTISAGMKTSNGVTAAAANANTNTYQILRRDMEQYIQMGFNPSGTYFGIRPIFYTFDKGSSLNHTSAAKTVTVATNASPTQLTITGHKLKTNDWVKLGTWTGGTWNATVGLRFFKVTVVDADNITIPVNATALGAFATGTLQAIPALTGSTIMGEPTNGLQFMMPSWQAGSEDRMALLNEQGFTLYSQNNNGAAIILQGKLGDPQATISARPNAVKVLENVFLSTSNGGQVRWDFYDVAGGNFRQGLFGFMRTGNFVGWTFGNDAHNAGLVSIGNNGQDAARALLSTRSHASQTGRLVECMANDQSTVLFSVSSAGLITTGSAQLIASNVALTNNAAAQVATMTNGPTAGNPTKWIPINDNGTIRNIPAW